MTTPVTTPVPVGGMEHASTALRWHRESWVVLRLVAIVGVFAPLTLVFFRPQVHGMPFTRYALTVVGLAMIALGVLVAGHFVKLDHGARPPESRGGGGPPPPPPRTLRQRLRSTPDGVVAIARQVNEGIGSHWQRSWLQHAAVHLVAIGYLLASGAFVLQVAQLQAPESSIYFLRALALDSGVTPLAPLLVGALLLVAWCSWHIARVALLGDMSAFEVACREGKIDASPVLGPDAARGSGMGDAKSFERAVVQVRAGLLRFFPARAALGLIALLLLFAVYVIFHFAPSIETILLGPILPPWPGTTAGVRAGSFDLLFRFLVIASVALSAWTLCRLVAVWNALRSCLQCVEAMPLGGAFARLPTSIAGMTRFTPFNAPVSASVDLAVDRAAQLRWRTLLATELPKYANPHFPAGGPVGTQPIRLRSLHGAFDAGVAAHLVALHAALCAGAAEGGAVGLDTDEAAAKPDAAAPTWAAIAQELVALHVIDYVEWVVRHLRQLSLSLILALAMTTILLGSYPFQPATVVKTFFFTLMVIAAGSIAMLLFQMNRDTTMSRITRTVPGQVTWDVQLVLNLLLVAAVPILTLVSTQFPQVREFLFTSWLTPALSAIAKS